MEPPSGNDLTDAFFEGYRTSFAADPESQDFAVITFRLHRVPDAPMGVWRGRQAAEQLAAFCREFAANFDAAASDPDRISKCEDMIKALGKR